MTDGTALLGCCHNFTDPILYTCVYIRNFLHYLRQNRQCLWGYSPGRPFRRYFVYIWPLKCNKLCLFTKLNLVLSARDCERTEKRLWSARVPKGLKRRANNTFLWRFRTWLNIVLLYRELWNMTFPKLSGFIYFSKTFQAWKLRF